MNRCLIWMEFLIKNYYQLPVNQKRCTTSQVLCVSARKWNKNHKGDKPNTQGSWTLKSHCIVKNNRESLALKPQQSWRRKHNKWKQDPMQRSHHAGIRPRLGSREGKVDSMTSHWVACDTRMDPDLLWWWVAVGLRAIWEGCERGLGMEGITRCRWRAARGGEQWGRGLGAPVPGTTSRTGSGSRTGKRRERTIDHTRAGIMVDAESRVDIRSQTQQWWRQYINGEIGGWTGRVKGGVTEPLTWREFMLLVGQYIQMECQ